VVSDGRGCLQWGYPACAVYVRLTPTARGSVRKLTSADPTLHAQLHRATVFPARNGPPRPPHWCAWVAFSKNDTLLKDGKGRKLRAGWHGGVKETSKETSSVRAPVYLEFTTRTVCLGGCGHKEVGCGGRRAPVGAARVALGEGGRANLARPPWRWRANHAPLELLLRLHATHLAVMGKKRGGGQAVRALPGVPSDSVACDNLVWLY
jgi:hypothetical protein